MNNIGSMEANESRPDRIALIRKYRQHVKCLHPTCDNWGIYSSGKCAEHRRTKCTKFGCRETVEKPGYCRKHNHENRKIGEDRGAICNA